MPLGVRRNTTAPAARICFLSETLTNFEQLDFENQRGVGRDHAAGAASAVAELGRDGELALAADLHPGHALVPALDHLAAPQRKLEGLAAVLARVEFLARLACVEEPAGVVHLDVLAGRGFGALANDEVLYR